MVINHTANICLLPIPGPLAWLIALAEAFRKIIKKAVWLVLKDITLPLDDDYF